MRAMTATTPTAAAVRHGLLARFTSFITEKHPFALRPSVMAFDMACGDGIDERDPAGIDGLRDPLRRMLLQTMADFVSPDAAASQKLAGGVPETTPGVSVNERLHHAVAELLESCDAFLRREAIRCSLTPDERREILRGMVVTRAIDNRLKAFFTGGEVRWGATSFQGKGFRSLGQEAIYAAPIRLRRGPRFRDEDGSWHGDVISPMIRDLGAALCMRHDGDFVRSVLNAQMGKAGPPMNGKDLHVGAFDGGVLPAMAPLGSPSLTISGMAMAFRLQHADRVAVTFIGEGATSIGEWHEAINAAAARKLPAVFCVQNNQTALATPVAEQSAVRVFADKALGYGIPSVTVDGTDPDAIAAAFTWAAERARAGRGPALIELVAMRMCGHAHHDDMLYLGKDPQPSWTYPPLTESGYADRELYDFWCRRDPIATYAETLEREGVIAAGELDRIKSGAEELVEREARAVIDGPWPAAELAGVGVLANEPRRQHVEVLDETERRRAADGQTLPAVEEAPPFDAKGKTFLEAVMLGVGDALRNDPRVFVYGEDVGGKYGNAFLLLRPLLKDHGDRIINSILSEGATLGVSVGAALAGLRPIAEIQFNDFVATGFNQLVNNAAKIRYRWNGAVPMVVRMPWGGLRHAGPYHSQNTEAWFYRVPGLKIVAPATPHDARALMAAAVADPDPVLYYEHIALYRDPRIKQLLSDDAPEPLPIGKAALRCAGRDLAIISWGAYTHVASRVAETLAKDGIDCAVLDLRSLQPLDREAILALARHCSRVLVIHEDTRTGSIGESIAAIIQEEAFEFLDAPVRVVGALDTPVPYSPPLEEEFLPGEARVERAARLLMGY
jgi:2-oxoisovalerate dehydrogenase E1 component